MLDPAISRAVFIRDRFKCRHCSNRSGLHPHHVIFTSHGGKDDLNNLITLCHCCHIDGIHGGKLGLHVVATLEKDLLVKFTRKNGWIPR